MNAHELLQKLSSASSTFDLFALLYDFVSPRIDPAANRGLAHSEEANAIEATFGKLALEIERADNVIPPQLWGLLAIPKSESDCCGDQFLLRALLLLKTIDRASQSLNYFAESWDEAAWPNTQLLLANNGRINENTSGMVVPRPCWRRSNGFPAWINSLTSRGWTAPEPRGVHYRRHFENLCRVPENSTAEVFLTVERRHSDSWEGSGLGFVPLIEEMSVGSNEAKMHPGPVRLRALKDNQFTIEVDTGVGCETLSAYAEVALQQLSRENTRIALFPEAVVPDPVLNRLSRVLRELAKTGQIRPYLTLGGTFTREGGNVAIVLDSLGDEILRQRKIHRYGMQGYEQKSYGLEELFGGRTREENSEVFPRVIRAVDLPNAGIRVLVMICEDGAQPEPYHETIRHLQPNLILQPVFAGPLCQDRGFAADAEALSAGALIAVANSACLPRSSSSPCRGGTMPLALIGVPWINGKHSHVHYLNDPGYSPESPTVLLWKP